MPDTYHLLAANLLDAIMVHTMVALPRLEAHTRRLFTASADTYDYSHHASLGVRGGLLYAFWSNGRGGEDRSGQVQRWSVRDEGGIWRTPHLLARAPMNPRLNPQTTTAINGGTASEASVLTSFYSEYKGRPADGAGGDGKWSLLVLTGSQRYDPERDTWTHRGVVLEDFLLNEGPRRTVTGRWIMTGEDHVGRTRIAYSDADDPAEPSWQVVEVSKGAGTRYKNEVSWLQRPNGALVLFMRDDGGSRRIWFSESDDDGMTWSTPCPTNMPDATSKCCAGRLSNGTYYLISNPCPDGSRIPLTIALSKDGATFDRLAILREKATAPRLPGRFKGAGYQYPNAVELNGELHVIYSRNKEDVEVLSVKLSELMALHRKKHQGKS